MTSVTGDAHRKGQTTEENTKHTCLSSIASYKSTCVKYHDFISAFVNI